MSKLFQLKNWLTIEDAARHLSGVFSEPVSEADVLRLALDRHLTLSVNLVNQTVAMPAKIVPRASAQMLEVPDFRNVGKTVLVLKGISIDDKYVIELETEVETLNGVYDLPMFGSEVLDLEKMYQHLTGGPEVSIDDHIEEFGAVYVRDELNFYQLQATWEDCEFRPGSRAALRELKERIKIDKLERQEADRLLQRHEQDRRAYESRELESPAGDGYFPAGGLPHDAVPVVRTSALMELQDGLALSGPKSEGRLGLRSETTYQNIIAGLLHLILGHTPGGKKQSMFESEAAIINYLVETHGDKPGISKRTLEEKLVAAKRSLAGN